MKKLFLVALASTFISSALMAYTADEAVNYARSICMSDEGSLEERLEMCARTLAKVKLELEQSKAKKTTQKKSQPKKRRNTCDVNPYMC